MPDDFDFNERRRGRPRGFSLMLVVMMVGALAVTGLLFIVALEDDAKLHGHERRRREARQAAEGGLMELLNDVRIQVLLPSSAGQEARLEYGKPSKSYFMSEDVTSPVYRAEVMLVRTTAPLESSQRRVRAVLYEAEVRATMPDGETADMEALIYRLGVAPSSWSGNEVFGR